MSVRCVTYNIQYGMGMDGRYDLGRIADAVRDADVIALQEVSRGSPWNSGADMLAEIAALFPDRFSVWHFPADADLGSHIADNRVVERRFQFGNMVLSRWPILASRGHLLPRLRRDGHLNLQRGVLEALVDTPQGTIRFYSIHLDHIDPGERLLQIAALKRIAFEFPQTGGSVTGVSQLGFPEPPLPIDFMLMGDFNFVPGSQEYLAMLGDGELVDATVTDPSLSYFDPQGIHPSQRLDFCFANVELATRVRQCRIDVAAEGSDHRPVWVTIA